MPVANLPESLIGKMVMQISDIHVGNRFDYRYIIDSFQNAQEYDPDFVVYTGDYITYEGEEQFRQLAEVMKFAVKGRFGTVGILGNHDYGKNWSEQHVADTVTQVLSTSGIEVLSNEQQTFNGLNVIGLDDYWGLNFGPSDLMGEIDDQMANLVLCHNPDVCDLHVWNGYRGWILSGHTHGGQCKPPFLPPPLLPVENKQYSSGQIELGDGRTLYINRALGHLWQIRFNVRPEITLFRLESANPG
ncbi:putative metallophosphoesterase YkuE [Echinicola rosea]|uniref:Metallophosphoesterase YkuE n=2 Tax=Echinicola rosea TaxID=1807691 RepID=A0ABQ1UXE9_9BACT|nr:putative metallophosphoesterase YkuE [Echinicola rosea]